MIYTYQLTVPAGTLAASPVSLDMPIGHGIIHKLEVEFPFGCNGAVRVTINRALHQVWPTNQDASLSANGYTIVGTEYEPIETPPYQLEAFGWSPGTAYSHIVTIRIHQLDRAVLEPGREAITFLGRMRALLFGGSPGP